jgi:predicted dehydrogenase
MSSKLRVGVIGVGGIAANQHLPGWASLPEVEVVAISDVTQERLDTVGDKFGIKERFTNFEDMVRLDLDIVDVCTPNRIHTPAVTAALGAGKHVICEKPLAVTTDEVRSMGELADASRLKLMTAQHMRYTPAARAVKKWIEAGGLGEVYHARVHAMRSNLIPIAPGFLNREFSGGGPCMDIGVHALDLSLWLMNHPAPARVTGTTKTNFAKGTKIPGGWGEWDRDLVSVEDFAAGFVRFQNGATLVLETSWLGHQKEKEDMSCQLFGLDGGVKWPSAEFTEVTNGAISQGSLTNPMAGPPPHHAELADFAACVRDDLPSPVPWSETIRVIAILEAIYQSQESGREVEVQVSDFPRLEGTR